MWKTQRAESLYSIRSGSNDIKFYEDYKEILELASNVDRWFRIKEAVQHKSRNRRASKKYPNLNQDIYFCNSNIDLAISEFNSKVVMMRLQIDE